MLPVRQWLFTELRPTYHQARIVGITTCGAMLLKINMYKINDKFKLTKLKVDFLSKDSSQIVYIT